MLNRRAFGFVVDIQDGTCDNTDTHYNITVVARLFFTSDNDNIDGFIWARLAAFSPNLVSINGESIMEGPILDGVLVATFGDHLTATFGSFGKSPMAAWRQEGAGPPYVADDRNLDPLSWSYLVTLSFLTTTLLSFSHTRFGLECLPPWKRICHPKGKPPNHRR